MICFLGFVAGVLMVAFGSENFLISDGILNDEFMLKMQNIYVDKRNFFFMCLGERLRTFFLMFLLAYSSVNIFYCNLFFGLQGFFIGSVMELLAVRYGGKGIFIYLEMIFPQGILYALGFLCLGCWCLHLEENSEIGVRKKMVKIQSGASKKKPWIALALILTGVILESYVNVELFL